MATHKPVIVHDLNGDLSISEGDDRWYVIHTKPRCEKKLADYARLKDIVYYLPQFNSVHSYQYRQVVFTKPMFPGYMFSRLNTAQRDVLKITGYAANFIKVQYERELLDELNFIYNGSKKKADFEHALWLSSGLEVEIVKGPLKGLHGVVADHTKIGEVRLQVNMLHQAVMVKVNPTDVKIIGDYIVVDKE